MEETKVGRIPPLFLNKPDKVEKVVLAKFASRDRKKGEPWMDLVKRARRKSVCLVRPLYSKQAEQKQIMRFQDESLNRGWWMLEGCT